jgi:hypothetical protein
MISHSKKNYEKSDFIKNIFEKFKDKILNDIKETSINKF